MSAERAQELLDMTAGFPPGTAIVPALETVIAQAEQLAAARTLVHEYRDQYRLLPREADPLLAVLGEAECPS